MGFLACRCVLYAACVPALPCLCRLRQYQHGKNRLRLHHVALHATLTHLSSCSVCSPSHLPTRLPACLHQAFVLPTIRGVPPYKTWTHIPRNVMSLDTGKRMFYTGGWVGGGVVAGA